MSHPYPMLTHQSHMTIVMYSHHFTCSRLSPRGREVVLAFAKRFICWKMKSVQGQISWEMDKMFASADKLRTTFRFHINSYPDFERLLREMQMGEHLLTILHAPMYEPLKVDLKIKQGWTDREDQIPFIEYLQKPLPRAKILELPMGRGKGYTTMRAISQIGQRTVAVLRPKYMEKWDLELRQIYEGFTDEKGRPVAGKVLQVSGSANLKELLIAAQENRLEHPFILIALNTYRNWIEEYKAKGVDILDQYACLPEDLFSHLRAGVRLVDEGHEEYHFLFELDLYTHVPSSIMLTATLVHKDPFLTSMYELQYPSKDRMKKVAPIKTADVYNMVYNFKNPEKIATTERGQATYSHTAFEKSIMRHVPTLNNYTNMVIKLLEQMYVHDKKPGEKALVYAASVKMCSHLRKEIAKRFTNLDVRRFVGTENDPYENLMQADICVSTVGRAGAAMDIPNLAVVLMTTALDSVQGNLQALGRLRPRDGKTVFMFLTASNIAKHVQYAEAKKRLFDGWIRTFSTVHIGWNV